MMFAMAARKPMIKSSLKKVSIGCLSSAPGCKFRAIRSKESNSKYAIAAEDGDDPGATTSSTQGKNGRRDLQRYADLEITTGQCLSKFTGMTGVTPSVCTAKRISPCHGLGGIRYCRETKRDGRVGYTRNEGESGNTKGYDERKVPKHTR